MLFVAYKKSISIEGNKINTYVVEFGSKLFHSNFNNAQIILRKYTNRVLYNAYYQLCTGAILLVTLIKLNICSNAFMLTYFYDILDKGVLYVSIETRVIVLISI